MTALVCTAAVGVMAAGWLFYDAYYSAGWHTHSEGTYYILPENGARAVGMQMINNTSYLFDEDGIMLTGWQEYDGGKYYLDSSGVLQKGRVTIDGEEYYFADDSGLFRTGLCDFNGNEYFFDDHGFPGSGFEMEDGSGRYFDGEGKMVNGWAEINGVRYYFTEEGDMAKGFLEIDGKTYYFAADGHLLTGFQKVEGGAYYFGANGALFKGWREDNGKYSYADETTGNFAVGFASIDGKTYYFDGDYHMVTGEQVIGGKKYIFGSDGVLTEGWVLNDNGEKFYYTREGAAIGLTVIDGLCYYFDKNGILQTEWYTDPDTGDLYYFGLDGVVSEGFISKEDDVYYFDPITHKAVTGWLTVYDCPADLKKEYDLYKSEMLLLDKYYKSLNDSSVKLTADEQSNIMSVVNGYTHGNGIKARSAYTDIGSDIFKLQYFGADHKMAQGPTNINGYIFYFDETTGIRSMGWHDFRGKRYYSNYAGLCLTGANTVDGKYYVFDDEGALISGLIQTGNALRCGQSNGSNVDQWLKNSFYTDEKGNIYYFNENGYAVTGRRTIDDNIYIFGEDYKLLSGFCEVGKDLYYMTEKGAEKNKWVSVSDTEVYYFGEDGKAAEGFIDIEGVTFCFKDHKMLRGWQTIDGKKYFFYKGSMCRGLASIEDSLYIFNADGQLATGWIEWNNLRYYCETEGIPLTDTVREIDGVTYKFSTWGTATAQR